MIQATLPSVSSCRSSRLALSLALLCAAPLLAQAGQLDSTFGTGGVVLDSVNQSWARGLGTQTSGAYVVTGRRSGASFVSRYLASGSLDTSFGGGGSASFGAYSGFLTHPVAVDAQDRILVGGYYQGDFAILRFTANGGIDSSFGSSGIVRLTGPKGYQAEAIVVQPDGRILTSGTGTSGAFSAEGSLVIARLLANGTLDKTFGTGTKKKGYTVVDLGASTSEKALPRQLAVFPDGSLVAGGASNSNGWRSMLVRLHGNGTLDAGFGANGVLLAGYYAYSLAGRPDGTLVIGGTTAEPQSVRRLLANGALDSTFGVGGIVDVAFPSPGNITDTTVRADGRILVNLAADVDPTTRACMPVQLLPGGTVDTTFGMMGFGAPVQFTGHMDTRSTFGGMRIDGAGRLVGAGVTTDPLGNQYLMMSRHQL